jgi:hypothetical protein
MCLALQKEQNWGKESFFFATWGKESDAGNKGFTWTFKGGRYAQAFLLRAL